MERLLTICKVLYPDFNMKIYNEPWSQGDEFLYFERSNLSGRIHKYQLIDIIKSDLLSDSDVNLTYCLWIQDVKNLDQLQ